MMNTAMQKPRFYLLSWLIVCLSSLLVGCAGVVVAGGAAAVNIAIDPRSPTELWQDKNLELEIIGLANKPPFRGQARITSSSFRGTVILIGQAQHAELLEDFIQQVENIQGVRHLHNQVRIQAPLTAGQISNDAWITTKVKAALATKPELRSVKISVMTENREVFLLGYVNSAHADAATEVARNVSGVKQVIRAFEYAD